MTRPAPSDIAPGIHLGLSGGVYYRRELGVVSNSALSRLCRSPAHYRAWVDGQDEDTPALRFGRAFHCALLEPERFADAHPTAPKFSGKGAVAAKETWLAAHEGAQPISDDDAQRIAGMLASVRAHPVAGKIIRGGCTEVTACWQDRATGLWCKARADYWHPQRRFLLDVKTTRDASPGAFARSIATYRYHVQQAIYAEGWASCEAPIAHYVILAVEDEPPYACATYYIDAAAEARGFDLLYRDRQRLAECLDSGHWPAYTDTTLRLSLPRWALTEE